MQNFIEITDLENLQAKTVNEDGKRMYQFEGMETKYPSVTTVTGLLNREHIKLWRKRVGEETANKITASATKRGTNFHQLVEDYLRAEKDIIIENDLQRGMFNAMQPVLDEIIPLALEAPLFSPNLEVSNLHYTSGGPYFEETANCGYAGEWLDAKAGMLKVEARKLKQ